MNLLLALLFITSADQAATCHREMNDDSCKGATPGTACLTSGNSAGSCVLRYGIRPEERAPYCACR